MSDDMVIASDGVSAADQRARADEAFDRLRAVAEAESKLRVARSSGSLVDFQNADWALDDACAGLRMNGYAEQIVAERDRLRDTIQNVTDLFERYHKAHPVHHDSPAACLLCGLLSQLNTALAARVAAAPKDQT